MAPSSAEPSAATADLAFVPPRRPFDPAGTGAYHLGLLVLAAVAFWPSYLSRLGAQTGYVHLHAATATLWLLLLVAQPLAMRTRRRQLHRFLGRVSYGVAAAVVLSIVLLAHSRIRGLDGPAFGFQSYILYLQLSLAALFALSYGLAVATRRTASLHARFMICTGLTLIDPIMIRLLMWADSTPAWNYQWATFGITDAILVGFIVLDRHTRRGRWVFPLMLGVFVAAQAPALLGFTGTGAWQTFARWFAGLGLS